LAHHPRFFAHLPKTPKKNAQQRANFAEYRGILRNVASFLVFMACFCRFVIVGGMPERLAAAVDSQFSMVSWQIFENLKNV
jgi:hypothetical protein